VISELANVLPNVVDRMTPDGRLRRNANWSGCGARALKRRDRNRDFTAGREVEMSILAWIVLGLIAGFIASKIYVGTGQGVLMDIVLGIVGAVVGGYLFDMLGSTGVTRFNIWSMLVAIIGAVLVLWIYHAVSGRSA